MKKVSPQLTTHVNIVVALDCEAKPLVAHFDLKRERPHSAFTVYGNGNYLTLIVSGPGKLAMSSACGYLFGVQSTQGCNLSAWLNIGVAGHRHMNVGTPVLIQKVEDSTNGYRYFPPFQLNVDCEYGDLLSVDNPETEYQEDCLYDMEASAFYGSASRFITSELIQIVKIISDNQNDPTTNVTKAKIQQLIEINLMLIETIVGQLNELSADYIKIHGPTEEFIQLEKKVNLTTNQKIQLERLVRQLKLSNETGLNEFLKQKKLTTAKALIKELRQLAEI